MQSSAYRHLIGCLVVAVLMGSDPSTAVGQDATEAPAKRVRAVRVPDGTIAIDGSLSEDAWRLAGPATDFIQQQPDEGQLTTERSEIRFLYDSETLYVGAMLYDDEPDRLIVNELRKDFGARDGDLLVVVLDTFFDRLNAYSFMTNPGGAIRDAQSSDNGRNLNDRWDGIWEVETSVSDEGWIVEYAISLKTLRFPVADEQTWGLQVFRLIRRKNELTMWNPVPRQYSQFRISYGGILEGIRDVRPGRNIRIKPFVTGRSTRGDGDDLNELDAGLDVKLGIGSNFVLDGTFRTDFSQVEADEQQVNLTRFGLFFPEQREFFLENQTAFQLGPPPTRTDLVPFFSRTIGLSPAGEPVPILGGLRLSGKSGRNLVGVLNIQTEEDERPERPLEPARNFTIARYGREFSSNSMVGVMYMGREDDDASNRVIGSDLRLNPTPTTSVDALLMRSEQTGIGSGTAWRLGVDRNTLLSQIQLGYTSLGESFRNEMGFVPRQGVDILIASAVRRVQPRGTPLNVRELRGGIDYSQYDRDGLVETRTISPSLVADFADGSTASISWNQNEETIETPFNIRPDYAIPPGEYRFADAEGRFDTSRARRVSLSGSLRAGDFWNGERRGFSTGGRLRFNEKLAATFSYSREAVDLPDLSFNTNLLVVRVNTSFSTRMFLNVFSQYNTQSEQVVTNVRFNFMHRPLSDIYLVLNETRSTNGDHTPSRTVALKVTHLLDF